MVASAGFAAALQAAEAGVNVVLLEKMDATGGSAMSGGCLAFAGTDLQAAEGIEDSAELLKRDLLEVGLHENDPALVQTYVDHQLETYEWLKKQGVAFSPVIEPRRVNRCPGCTPSIRRTRYACWSRVAAPVVVSPFCWVRGQPACCATARQHQCMVP